MNKKLKSKIKEEINQKRLWKAKEMLQSSIASSPYDEETYFEYAKLLYQLGDMVESGKYFLLTNTNDINHSNAIKEFLNRYKQKDYFSHFPRKFKKVPIDEYPKNLKLLLEENPNIKKNIYVEQKENIDNKNYKETFTDKIVGMIVISILVSIVIIFFIGVVATIKYLWALL